MDRAYVSITIANTISIAIMLGVIAVIVYGVRRFVIRPGASDTAPVTMASA